MFAIRNSYVLGGVLLALAVAIALLERDVLRLRPFWPSRRAWWATQGLVAHGTAVAVCAVVPGVPVPVRAALTAALVLFAAADLAARVRRRRRATRAAATAWDDAAVRAAHHAPDAWRHIARPDHLQPALAQRARRRICFDRLGHCYHPEAGAIVDWWCCVCGGGYEGLPQQRCKVCVAAAPAQDGAPR